MIKISLVVNLMILIICSICGWKIMSDLSHGEFLNNEISQMKMKIMEVSTAFEEAKKGHQDKIGREKRKNIELEDFEKASIDKITDLTRKRDEMKIILDENSKKSDLLSSEIQERKVSLSGVDREIETYRKELDTLTLSIPTLQSNVISLENQILATQEKQKILEKEISIYDQETNKLKQHYNLTKTALQKDFYEHPWLERGERVSVAFSKVDLDSGIVMFPIGKNHGLEESMRFSVRSNGKPICQIRIKDVEYDHCVALIIPLLGNPKQLMEVTKLDLIYL